MVGRLLWRNLKKDDRLEKTFEIIFSETAVETYNSIFDQINDRWGKIIAIKFEKKTFATLEIISKKPFIFKAVEIDNFNIRKSLINKNCSFFYEVSSLQIQILYFWDNRQDPLFNDSQSNK